MTDPALPEGGAHVDPQPDPGTREDARPGARAIGRVVRGPRIVGIAYYAAQGVLTTLLAFRILGFVHRPFSIPLVYRSDALSGGSQIKGVLEHGWYEHNPMLGFPAGQNLHDFPIADNLQYAFARLFGTFIDQWGAVYNLCYLVTYPLTAMAATWFLRVVGCRRSTAFFFGLLYAFTPYHFFHGQAHLALSLLFVVPLFAALLFKVLDGRSVWTRRAGPRRNPLTWVTSTNLGTIATVALLGTASSYYSVFGLILMTITVAVVLLRREFRRAAEGVSTMAVLVGVMVANMAPDVLFARSAGPSFGGFARQALESELYAFKLTALVLPVPWHRVTRLAEFRSDYNAEFPLPSESPALGIVAAVGFVFLLVAPFVTTLVARRSPGRAGAFNQTQQQLALFNIVAFLFGTVGGFSTLFALWVSPDIRAWNRFVVYLALFALASVALLVQEGLGAFRRRVRSRASVLHQAIAIAVCGTIALVGLYDATPRASWNADPTVIKAWRNDEAYVASIEERMPAGAAIFELPVMAFPESLPINDMDDYEPIRPYLHSSDLRWSYGAVKGRPKADWQHVLAGLPVSRMLTILAATGFQGIHLDRFGYPHHRPGLLGDQLESLLGPPLRSPNGRFEFFDMRHFVEQTRALYPASTWTAIDRHARLAPAFYWQQGGFKDPGPPDDKGRVRLLGSVPAPRGLVANPGAPVDLTFTFELHAIGVKKPADVTVHWPDGSSELVAVGSTGTTLTRTLEIPSGTSELTFSGPPGLSTVNLLDFGMDDPVLAQLELKGPAAALQACVDAVVEAKRHSTGRPGQREPLVRPQASPGKACVVG